MNRGQIEECRAWFDRRGMLDKEMNDLCNLALRGLEIGEPVAVVYAADPIPEGTHGRWMSWLVNPINLPNKTKLYAKTESEGNHD